MDKYWRSVLSMKGHDSRPYAVQEHCAEMDDQTYWDALRWAWSESDRCRVTADQWYELFTADRDEQDKLMSDDEWQVWETLPERVSIYRGWNALNHRAGLSWTLDKEKAEWFARRFENAVTCGGEALISGTVLKHRIIALFLDRDEQEVLTLPKYVYNRDIQWVDAGHDGECGVRQVNKDKAVGLVLGGYAGR